MKCNYYKFDVFQPYIFGGEIHKRLVDAKRAFLQHIAQGHSMAFMGMQLKMKMSH